LEIELRVVMDEQLKRSFWSSVRAFRPNFIGGG